MLGLIKLGAVMIPATTLLVGDDLRDRFDRGDVKHVIVGHAHAGKFDEMPGQYTRIVVGADVAGWQRFEQAYEASADFTPEGQTLASDPLLLYFTSGTTARRPAISEFGAQYLNGPLQLNAAILQSKASPNESTATVSNSFTPIPANINTKTTTISASYDLGVARLGASNSKIRNDAGFDVTNGSTAVAANLTSTAGKTQSVANMLYAQIPLGQSRILLSTGNVSVDASPVPALIGQKTNVSGIAAEYDLSKRTFVYARYQAGKANAANCATTIVSGGAAGGSCVSGASALTGGLLATPTFNLAAFGVSHQF